MVPVIRRCPIRGFLLLLFLFSEMFSCFLLGICHKMQWFSSHLCPLLSPSPLPRHLIPHTDCRGKLPSCGCPGFYHTHPAPRPLQLLQNLVGVSIFNMIWLCASPPPPPRHLSLPLPALCPLYNSPVASTLQETPREFSNHFLHLQPVSQWSLLEPCSPVCSQFQLHQLLTGLHG